MTLYGVEIVKATTQRIIFRIANWAAANNSKFLETVKEIPGRRYDRRSKTWSVPVSRTTINRLKRWIPSNTLASYRKYFNLVEQRKAQWRQAIEQANALRGPDGRWTANVNWREYIPKPELIRGEPYPFQTAAIKAALEVPQIAIFFEPGLGKTYTALHIIKHVFAEEPAAFVLVVSPLAVLSAWQTELEKWAPELVDKAQFPPKTKEKKVKVLSEIFKRRGIVLFANYEFVRDYVSYLKDVEWDLIVLDESTRIKNPGSQTAKALMKLAPKAKRRIIMTGTPITESATEAYTQLHWLLPGFWQDRWGSYKAMQEEIVVWREINVRDRRTGRIVSRWVPVGVRKEGEEYITNQLKLYGLMATDRDVPGFERGIEIQHELIADVYSSPYELAKVVVDFAHDWESQLTHADILWLLNKLRQANSGFIYLKPNPENSNSPFIQYMEGQLLKWATANYQVKNFGSELLVLDHPVDVPKDAYLLELLEEYKDKSIVIWYVYRWEREKLKKLIPRGIKIYEIDSSRFSQIKGTIKRFKEGKGTRVLLAQTASLKHGLTIPTDVAFYYSLDWSYDAFIQSKRRHERIGLGATRFIVVTTRNRATKVQVDHLIWRALQQKRNLVDEIKSVKDLRELEKLREG